MEEDMHDIEEFSVKPQYYDNIIITLNNSTIS